jgi:hypothetical protein
MSPDDEPIDWDDIDAEAVRRMIADSDAEGGEISLEEVVRQSAKAIMRR